MIVGTSTSCSTSCGSRTEVRRGTSTGKILGTSIACSGSGEKARKKWRVSGNCSTHLRRRIIESRKQRDRIDDLLHGAPLCPLLRSRHGRQPVWPRSAGLFFKAEKLRLGSVGGGPARRRVVQLAPPTPQPWLSSVPVGRYGASLQPGPSRRSAAHVGTHERSRRCRPPHRGSRHIANTIHGRQLKAQQKSPTQTEQPV